MNKTSVAEEESSLCSFHFQLTIQRFLICFGMMMDKVESDSKIFFYITKNNKSSERQKFSFIYFLLRTNQD